MNLGNLIRKAAKEHRHRTALLFDGKAVSFLEVNTRVNQLANALLELGIHKGDRVAFLGSNSLQFVEADFAAAKCGFIRVPLRSRLTPGELVHIINDSQANTLIVEEGYLQAVLDIQAQLQYVKYYIAVAGAREGMLSYEELLANAPDDEPSIDVLEEDVYALIYTTGTTGKPKGAMQTHGNLLWVIRSVQLDILGERPIQEQDVLLSCLPLMHAPLIFILAHFVKGVKHVILPAFKPVPFLETVQKERVTTVFLVPTVVYMLLESTDVPRYDLSSIRTILYGGSPMVPERLVDAIRLFGNVFVQAYGLAEAFMPITFLSKKAHADAVAAGKLEVLSSAGKESTFQEVRIVDDAGRDVRLGDPGEIAIRGDNVMKGYWNNEDATHSAIRDRWFYTGDVGRMDGGGYVYIVDRKNEMIITGGLNVYPKEVEDLLYRHPAVYEVVVIGVPDDKWGEAIKAVAVRNKGAEASESELIEFCKGKIADYKIPKSVDFVEALPKGGSEKILRREIKASYWKGHARQVH